MTAGFYLARNGEIGVQSGLRFAITSANNDLWRHTTMNGPRVRYTGNDVDKGPLTNFADRFTGTSR